MRDLDYTYNQRDDGGMAFRLQLPLGRARSGFRPCADGQFGGIIKVYREWKISGDDEWLKKLWPAVKKAIDFAWSETNADRWDADRDGVLEGRQHHTLDMELFGPNSWLEGFYLAALKAGAEMADYLGEKDTAEKYLELYGRGKAWSDGNLFNGSYYRQIVDIKDKSVTDAFGASDTYWNAEAGEIKYQIADGCIIDQVLAQWHCNLNGLGDVFDKTQVRSALRSIYANNYRKNLRDSFNACRIYSLNDESGLCICGWPDGTYKPVVPITYAEETMNGFEYQAAVHMLQEGMYEEGFECIRAIRERYDGERRNPWNEFECGSNYARSMASYAILLACSGFLCDMTRGYMRFAPLPAVNKNGYSTLWSVDSGWGSFRMENGKATLTVLYGSLKLRRVEINGKIFDGVLSLSRGEEASFSLS